MKDKDKKNIVLAVIVASLGYFVDIYDLLLFSIVRVSSLKGIEINTEQEILDLGLHLLNMQMLGMLLGGVLWGILGDKKGRLSVLFGSIFLYSIANLLNGFVQNIEQYSLLRLIAGIGLAGELGAGITLVSEIMSKETRGYGTTIVATIGILGAVVGAFVGKIFDWRTAYFIGGIMGIVLLFLRVGLLESKMFSNLRNLNIQKGNFFQLFKSKEIFFRYLNCILIGLPIWFVVGILITFSPEFGKEFGMKEIPLAGESVKYCYIGLSIGDLTSGLISQKMKSRKKAVALFIILTFISIISYFTFANFSLKIFYFTCLILGFSIGYWAVFVTISAENFGTNIRATVTTSVPNFIRGSVVPMTIIFQELKSIYSISTSAMIIGFSTILISLISLSLLKETYGKNLDYIE